MDPKQTSYLNKLKQPHKHYIAIFLELVTVLKQKFCSGTRAPPREIAYDNSILPQDPYPGDVRVATPPRSLTLDKYTFPGINDHTEEDNVEDKIPVVKPRTKFTHDAMNDSIVSRHNDTFGLIGTTEGLTPAEEVNHLRRQMTKLNRRVIALELENINRMQKEKIFYGVSIAYFLLKMIVWLNKSNQF